MRVASFNVQNMRLRHRDGQARLDGAEDRDVGPMPLDGPDLDRRDRRLTAQVLRDIDADVVALQEVFDSATLDYFHDRFLAVDGFAPYPERVCLPGNDGRGLDLAALSRRPLTDVRSHADVTRLALGLPGGDKPDAPALRRDCLMVTVGELTLVICHFKAPYPNEAAAWRVRRAEAEVVRRLIERRFPPGGDDLWLVIGDLNEPRMAETTASDMAIAPLLAPFTVDLLDRIAPEDRWTFHDPDNGAVYCPDGLLASSALARRWPGARPKILREGMGREVRQSGEARLGAVGWHRPHASDHAAIYVDFEGL